MKLVATVSRAIALLPLVLAISGDTTPWNIFDERDDSNVNKSALALNGELGCVNKTLLLLDDDSGCVNKSLLFVDEDSGCVNTTVLDIYNASGCVNKTVVSLDNAVCVSRTSTFVDDDDSGSVKKTSVSPDDDPRQCNGQWYDPRLYTCYGVKGDELLCSWQDGIPQQRCGNTKKCYHPQRYDCDNNTLHEIPSIESAFKLTAINLQYLPYVDIKACNNRFWLMESDSCTLCPEKVGVHCPLGKETVFLPNGAMSALVPGGQRYFVDPKTGALQFSVPHSSAEPEGAIHNFLTLNNGGFFVFPGAKGWLACHVREDDPTQPPPVDPESIQANGAYQIFAQLSGVENEGHCVPITVTTSPWEAGNDSVSSFAAWEYV